MSEIDYIISLPAIPAPRLTADLGIPDIPNASLGQSGSLGTAEIVTGIPDSLQQGQSGFIFGQLNGSVSIADPMNGATTAEYQSALASVYSSRKPKYGDIITLTTSQSAFDSRFIVFPQGDGAPSNATVAFTSELGTWYAYNFSTTSLSGLTDALDQALGMFDTTGTVPRDDDVDDEEAKDTTAPFVLGVNGLYEVNAATGLLEIGSSIISLSCRGGKVEPIDGLSATVSASNSVFPTPPQDGEAIFTHFYVQYKLTFVGAVGSRVPTSISNQQIVTYENNATLAWKEGGAFNASGSEYTHVTYIGSIGVARRGNRRYAKITQQRQGDISGIQNFNTTQSGTETDSGGTDVAAKTKSGLREVILCVNGTPYSTFIITSALFEIT